MKPNRIGVLIWITLALRMNNPESIQALDGVFLKSVSRLEFDFL